MLTLLRMSLYRVFRSGMCFSRWLKMTQKRNLHFKTRLLYYQNSPPFHFIAINFIKICHKCSKFQKNWKMMKKIYQFFLFKIIFLMKTFYSEVISTYFEKKIFFEKFYVMIIFLKNPNFKFFKTSTTPRGMNGKDGLRGSLWR